MPKAILTRSVSEGRNTVHHSAAEFALEFHGLRNTSKMKALQTAEILKRCLVHRRGRLGHEMLNLTGRSKWQVVLQTRHGLFDGFLDLVFDSVNDLLVHLGHSTFSFMLNFRSLGQRPF